MIRTTGDLTNVVQIASLAVSACYNRDKVADGPPYD